MTIQNWSDEITVVELADEPLFTDELNSLMVNLQHKPSHVIVNFAAIGFLNSSNIARLLRLRKLLMSQRRHLIFSNVDTQVWGVFLMTGLDKVFEFTNDISTALATLQMAPAGEATPSRKKH